MADTPAASGDPWWGGDPPALARAPMRSSGSVPRRLGESGIRAGDEDLVDVLARAYEALGEV